MAFWLTSMISNRSLY